MTTLPPAPLPPSQAAAQAPPALPVIARVSAPPPALIRLPANTLIEGQVIQAAAKGQPAVVRTDLGPLTLRTPFPLPQGAQVTLDFLSLTQGGGALLRIAALNGQPLGQPPAPLSPLDGTAGRPGSATTTGPSPGGVHGGTAPGSAPPDTRGVITATVIRAAASPGGTATIFEAGTLVRAHLMSVHPPGTATPTATTPINGPSGPGAAVPGTMSGTQPPGAEPRIAGGTPGPATSTAGPAVNPAVGASQGGGTGLGTVHQATAQVRASLSSVVGRISAALLPTGAGTGTGALPPTGAGAPSITPASATGSGPTPQSPPGPPSGAPQSSLTGTIEAGGTASRTLVTTPAGTLALHLRLDAPPGSRVTLGMLSATRPTPSPPTTGSATSTVAQPSSITQGGTQGWPALTQATETLARTDPAAAQALQQVIPRPGPQLTLALGSLTAALRAGGDSRHWPGTQPLTALESSGTRGERLAEALRSDLRALAGRTRESPGGEWRAITLPFADGAEIAPITLVTRVRGGPIHDRDADDASPSDRKTESGDRFIVDLTLSALGRLQIDGLMRPRARQLHLILRTAEPLPPTMREDLIVIAETGLTALGLEGGLTFQADGRFLDPVPETASSAPPAAPPRGVIA